MGPQCTAQDQPAEKDPSLAGVDPGVRLSAPPAPWTLRSASGAILLVLSWALWLAVPVVPFLPFSAAEGHRTASPSMLPHPRNNPLPLVAERSDKKIRSYGRMAEKTSIVAAALVAAELAFWAGLALMGPELADAWKKWFPSGWWRMLWWAGTHRKHRDAAETTGTQQKRG